MSCFAVFWLGANYGGNAQLSMLAGLAEVDDIKSEMETVLKIDAKYEAGSEMFGKLFDSVGIILDLDFGLLKLDKFFEVWVHSKLCRRRDRWAH